MFPSDLNIISNYLPRETFKVGGVFDIDILNYDLNSIILSFKNNNTDKDSFYMYTDEIEGDYKLKDNQIISNLVLNALKFEKIIYYFFGILVIAISCLMLFISIVQSIKEKEKQINILVSIGLFENKIRNILLLHNFLLVTILLYICTTNLIFLYFYLVHYLLM